MIQRDSGQVEIFGLDNLTQETAIRKARWGGF